MTLVSDSSPVERSGAAQGLAEVCLAMGDQKLRQVLEDALPLQWHSRSAAREGLLWLLSFLPAAMGGAFGPLVPSTLPVILGGLSDEGEGVREVALRAGQVLVGVLGRGTFAFVGVVSGASLCNIAIMNLNRSIMIVA